MVGSVPSRLNGGWVANTLLILLKITRILFFHPPTTLKALRGYIFRDDFMGFREEL